MNPPKTLPSSLLRIVKDGEIPLHNLRKTAVLNPSSDPLKTFVVLHLLLIEFEIITIDWSLGLS